MVTTDNNLHVEKPEVKVFNFAPTPDSKTSSSRFSVQIGSFQIHGVRTRRTLDGSAKVILPHIQLIDNGVTSYTHAVGFSPEQAGVYVTAIQEAVFSYIKTRTSATSNEGIR